MSKKGIIVCISGFSGVGKGTLVKRLVNDYDSYALSVSMTTREPRQGEVNGKDYFFVSKEEFRKKINDTFYIKNIISIKRIPTFKYYIMRIIFCTFIFDFFYKSRNISYIFSIKRILKFYILTSFTVI